jgi:hypothetical protein
VSEGGYVSRRLLQLVMPVFPDRRMFRIHDPEVSPDAFGAPLPPVGTLVSANREQMWVGSLQQDIDVRLVLEEWDGQPLLPDAWDEEGKARLYLRGQLSIDMGSAGVAVSRIRLSGGVGNYEVRVYARYREAVVQMYAELFDQHKDPLSDEFQREKRKLEGVERYLVQLWRDSLRRPADQDAFTGAGRLAAGDVRMTVLVPPAGMPDVPALALGLVACLAAALAGVLVVAAVLAGGPSLAAGAVAAGRLEAWGLVVDLGLWARKGTMT